MVPGQGWEHTLSQCTVLNDQTGAVGETHPPLGAQAALSSSPWALAVRLAMQRVQPALLLQAVRLDSLTPECHLLLPKLKRDTALSEYPGMVVTVSLELKGLNASNLVSGYSSHCRGLRRRHTQYWFPPGLS